MSDDNNSHIGCCEEKIAASRRQLDAARCNEQVVRTVALNRLDVTHDALIKAASAGGLTTEQCQVIVGGIEYSMALLESSGRERPVVIW